MSRLEYIWKVRLRQPKGRKSQDCACHNSTYNGIHRRGLLCSDDIDRKQHGQYNSRYENLAHPGKQAYKVSLL